MTEPTPSAPDAATLLTALLGTWHLHRSIPGHAEAIGTATLSLVPDRPATALYQERVTLRLLTGPHLHATQHYLFSALAGATLMIYRFADPLSPTPERSPSHELFHTLHLTLATSQALTAHSTHTCTPDRYDSTYTFGPGPRWHTAHHVTGPRKRYTATTLYTRP